MYHCRSRAYLLSTVYESLETNKLQAIKVTTRRREKYADEPNRGSERVSRIYLWLTWPYFDRLAVYNVVRKGKTEACLFNCQTFLGTNTWPCSYLRGVIIAGTAFERSTAILRSLFATAARVITRSALRRATITGTKRKYPENRG